MRRVLMSDELFEQLGATRVDWGTPDADGFYTPTVYRNDEVIGDAIHAAVHPGHPWSGCHNPDIVYTRWLPRFHDRLRRGGS